MKKYLYLIVFLFASSTLLVAQSSFGFSLIGIAPSGNLHHTIGYSSGMAINYESGSLFNLAKKTPISIIGSIDSYSLGIKDDIADAALPSTPERLGYICTYGAAIGLNIGGRISTTPTNGVRIYGDLFASVRRFSSSAAYHPYGDGEDIDDEKVILYKKTLPQVGFATGVQFQLSPIFALDLKFNYAVGSKIKVVNTNNISIEENRQVTYNLENSNNSNMFSFQFGMVIKLPSLKKL